MKKKLLLIDIQDEEILTFLNTLKEIFSNRKFTTGVHITLKGPQKTFRKKAISKFMTENEPIYIHDVGMFKNDNNFIVYLKARCDAINRYIWYKPDYSNDYNPHVTLYKGNDKHIADSIYILLKEENLTFVSKKYSLIIHTVKQPDLFSSFPNNKQSELNIHYNGTANKDDIITRAKDFILQRKPATAQTVV